MPLVILLGLPIDTSVLGVPFGIWPFELYRDSRQRVCILLFQSSIRKQARSQLGSGLLSLTPHAAFFRSDLKGDGHTRHCGVAARAHKESPSAMPAEGSKG